MTDKITELGNHSPTVKSVISRFNRHEDDIKGITAVIEWNDGKITVCHNTSTSEGLAHDALILQKYIMDSIL